MSALRFPWLWWGLGWLLVVGVVLGSLGPVDVIPVALVHDKLVHAGSYCILTLWFSGVVERGRGLVAVAALLFLLGAGLDVLQGAFTRRTFDLWDVAANGGGILLGFVVARLLVAGWCARVERFVPV